MLRLWPNIRFGTEGYPEKVARRLRALNITTWIASAVSGGYAIIQLFDPTPARWMVAAIDAVVAIIFASIPLLHRLDERAAALALILMLYTNLFFLIFLLGTDTGMQLYYLVATALAVVFFGVEEIRLAAVLGGLGAILIIALQALAPFDSGILQRAVVSGSFATNAFVSCGVLLLIVFYALRQAARAEAAADRERGRSDALLANILPDPVVERLKDRPGKVIVDGYNDASILFADMEGFTARASDTAPDDLVEFLNRVFTEFDRHVERHGLEKIKTTGDAYMVVSGVPVPRPDHAEVLAQLALDMRWAAINLRDPQGRSVSIRIGIGSGPVVAGVVGTRKFFYDVWGDAVSMASRMEVTGVPG